MVLGLCEIIYMIRMLVSYPGFRVKNYNIIVLKSTYALKQLYYLSQKISWFGDSYALGIIALTDYLNEDEINQCIKFASGKNILFYSLNELKDCKILQGEF